MKFKKIFSYNKMETYTIRVDIANKDLDVMLNDILNGVDKWVYGREGGSENPHIHILCETKIKMDAMRKRIKKYCLGNRDYSLTRCKDKLKYFAYVVKDGDIDYAGYTFEDVSDALCYNEEVKLDMDANKKVKKDKGTVLQQVSRCLNEEHPEHKDKWSLRSYVNYVVRWYKDKDVLYREFQVLSVAQSLYLKFNIDATTVLTDMIMSRLEKKI